MDQCGQPYHCWLRCLKTHQLQRLQGQVTTRKLLTLGYGCRRKYPGTTIVTDSVTSNGLTAFIEGLGGKHFRCALAPEEPEQAAAVRDAVLRSVSGRWLRASCV
jgi:hypothetical protein